MASRLLSISRNVIRIVFLGVKATCGDFVWASAAGEAGGMWDHFLVPSVSVVGRLWLGRGRYIF